MVKVAIIGAGNFGGALGHILSVRQNVSIALWDTDPIRLRTPISLEDAIRDAAIIFLCIPSWSLRQAAEGVVPLVSSDVLVVSPTKGIEQHTNKTTEEVLTETFHSGNDIALLHGPMLASEMVEGLPSFATVASHSQVHFSHLETLFRGTTLTLEYSDDVHGVALAGVLKNIYSIGLGMTEAMRLGSNFRGWYVRCATKEMSRIIAGCGGKADTAYTSAGVGDLVATGLSPTSRNCKVGHEIVQSGECSTVSEGGESLPQMMELLQAANVDAPLATSISDIVAGHADASTILAASRGHL